MNLIALDENVLVHHCEKCPWLTITIRLPSVPVSSAPIKASLCSLESMLAAHTDKGISHCKVASLSERGGVGAATVPSSEGKSVLLKCWHISRVGADIVAAADCLREKGNGTKSNRRDCAGLAAGGRPVGLRAAGYLLCMSGSRAAG